MKVLISFDPNKKQDNFEGSRLRKSIKGALEILNMEYTSNIKDIDYDVLHLISSDDISLLNKASEENKPIVVSCLNAESDPVAAFLDFEYKDGKTKYSLSHKTLKFLNSVSRILVPTSKAKEILEEFGVTTKIEVVMPGVNLSRFDISDEEKNLFYRYFREDTDKKLVVGNGSYDDIDGMGAFINAAKMSPNAIFYFFGQSKTFSKSIISKLEKVAPPNCHFKEIVQDDIYRSALVNASIFVLPCYKNGGIISLLEAMAAKCEIIVRRQDLLEGFIIDGVNGHIGQFSETLVDLIKQCLNGTLKTTIGEAYKQVSQYSLVSFGEKLKQVYEDVNKFEFILRRNSDD